MAEVKDAQTPQHQVRDPGKLREKLLAFAKGFPFYNLIGFELIDLGPGWSKARIPLRPDLRNPDGVMHGGVIATLVDIGITQAILMTDAYQEVRETKGTLSSVDLRIKYLRPLTQGAMTCESKVIHQGRRVIHADSVVTNDQGKPLATGDAIYVVTLGQGAGPKQKQKEQAEGK